MSASTKELIINTVLQMIGQEGIQGITVREIAKRANVNIAAVNYHFGSKEVVINQALSFYTKTMSSSFEVLEQKAEPIEKLKKFLKTFSALTCKYPGVTKSFVNQMMYQEITDQTVLSAQKQGVDKLAGLLKQITGMTDDKKINHLCLQLMSSTLYPVLISSRLPTLYDIDYMDELSRNSYIEQLVKCIVKNK